MTDDMDARARVKRLEQEVADRDEEIAALIDAQADMREARDNAEQRAQRAEAECERLREALQYITSESGCEHFTTGLGSCYRSGKREDAEDWADKVCFPCKAHAALATPPPEGKPELLTGHGDQRPKRGGWAPGFYANTCQSCGRSFVGDKWAWTCADCAYADTSSEQAHGDARSRAVEDTDNLELLREIENSEGDGTEEALTPYGAKCIADELEQLRTLTASGVPYVPEEVRRLPERFRSIALKCQEVGIDSKAEAFWSASTHTLEALAAAPAVPNSADKECPECGSTNTFWWLVTENNGGAVDGRIRMSDITPLLVQSCGDCSETIQKVNSDEIGRIQIAAAPQRGGE